MSDVRKEGSLAGMQTIMDVADEGTHVLMLSTTDASDNYDAVGYHISAAQSEGSDLYLDQRGQVLLRGLKSEGSGLYLIVLWSGARLL